MQKQIIFTDFTDNIYNFVRICSNFIVSKQKIFVHSALIVYRWLFCVYLRNNILYKMQKKLSLLESFVFKRRYAASLFNSV